MSDVSYRRLAAGILTQFFADILSPIQSQYCFLDWIGSAYFCDLCDMAEVSRGNLHKIRSKIMDDRPPYNVKVNEKHRWAIDGLSVQCTFLDGYCVSITDDQGRRYLPYLPNGDLPNITIHQMRSRHGEFRLEERL